MLGLLMMIAIIGCSDDNDDLEPWQLEVDELKAATAKYVNVDVATAEGFFDASGFVPNMGHHYILPERIDETFELSKPEILLYVPNANGVMEIVAVEYAVPIEDLDNPGLPPEGFTGKDDVWEINPNLKQWQLHVWIYTENPEGIFTAHNPAIGEGN
ncbi:hypothetical protein EQY75_00225 [Muriicola soli]|uniref:Uncharacterized protein n=1 Tax=Muriicola soli TaxID=2507538 RepID=A0A411ECN4_9FLAO|nr:hypothetical protein EQY75_00225 [Muriicola soli]